MNAEVIRIGRATEQRARAGHAGRLRQILRDENGALFQPMTVPVKRPEAAAVP
jgi:hypothetical protein